VKEKEKELQEPNPGPSLASYSNLFEGGRIGGAVEGHGQEGIILWHT